MLVEVTNTTDSGVLGDGSLRGEIAFAEAMGGGETIIFDPTVFATARTITLDPANGPLDLQNPSGTLTIQGPTIGVTISGGNGTQVFKIERGTSAELNGLTIQDGYAAGNGGAIYNSGSLFLTGTTLTNNVAGGDGGASGTMAGFRLPTATFPQTTRLATAAPSAIFIMMVLGRVWG